MLEQNYGVAGDNLAQQLTDVAGKLASEYWDDHQRDFRYIVDGSFLAEYDDYNIEVQFKSAATVSIAYALMSRCGLDTEQYFQHEDFMPIFDFNTPATVGALGAAVSQINQQVLRQIGVTIQIYEREQLAERSVTHGEQPDLHDERRLSDSRPEADRTAGEAPGQVRQDAESVPEGTPAPDLQSAAADREAVPAPHRDRRDSAEPSGADDAPAGERRGRDGAAESQRPDALGGPDEHLQSTGRGDSDGGAYSQLSFFLSEAEQIRIIDEAENVKTSSAFSFAQADIDHVLRLGGNTYRQRERIVAAFEEQKSTTEIADTLKTLYHGGNGIGSITAWYAEDGIHLSHGKTARYDKSAQVISWESAAERIGQLLQDGQFATNVELAEAAGYERSLLAEKFWNLYHDFSEEAREAGYLPILSNNPGRGFPEESAWLTEQLKSPEFRQNLAEEYAAFWTAYQQDRDLLRFHYHKPKEIWENLQDLSLPRTTFTSQLTEVPSVKQFISEDEIDAAMTRGSGFEGGKGRVFTFFQEPHTDKEKVDFLKHKYGIGGHSHALSGAMKSDESHDGKGLHYKKDGCPDVHFTWEKVAKRITDLIQKGRYLTEQEQAEYDKIQAEKALAEEDALQAQQPDPAVWEYNGVKERHPDDIILYQMGDFFELYGEDAKTAAAELDLNLTTRAIPGGGRVEMCGFPANRLEQVVEQLRDKHDVTISAVPKGGRERQEYSMPSIDHEAEQHINAQEAEFGADGTRVFQETEAAAAPTIRELHEQYKPIVLAAVMEDVPYRNACGHSDHENAVIEGNAAIRRAVLGSGNMELVHVYRYVTEGTFDAYLWQTVENKQKFISQIMTSKSPVRSCDDVDETALSFAEIKALCAGDPRIKERMDLDVEVARLKLMKADHQSKQYRLEDQLLKYFPQEIETNKGFIKGFEADLETLAAHPHPEDGFAGMEIRGDVLTDKENAGAALLDACKEVKGSEPVQIGSYRGFTMSVEFSAWKQEYTLLLKGQMTHRASLGTDPRGNLTRIDNALAQMPQRLEAVKNQLDNLYQQQAAAKEEIGKPFPFEDDLRVKSARLVELDTLLNIDGKGHAQPETVVAKSARPSVLDSLKRPVPPRSPEKKPKQHEEVR